MYVHMYEETSAELDEFAYKPGYKNFVLVHLLLCYYIFVRIFSKLHARMRSDTEAKSRISSSLDGKPSYESTDRKQGC